MYKRLGQRTLDFLNERDKKERDKDVGYLYKSQFTPIYTGTRKQDGDIDNHVSTIIQELIEYHKEENQNIANTKSKNVRDDPSTKLSNIEHEKARTSCSLGEITNM